ncbi:hypothetical protein [Faecalibaculum rodentium]|jgi:hypothetical protein|uniref:hypothetical protein n=1 Tax=Faecalibaculum rodentium TaxID=1702221 RepID=UPI0024918DA7|nr:hypothetical protein [Faecalibaculum rodentium]
MLIIKTMTGQAVNAEQMVSFFVSSEEKTQYQAVNSKDDKGWTYPLGLYLSPERAIEELNKLIEFLSKRNNGVYVMEDYVITGKDAS